MKTLRLITTALILQTLNSSAEDLTLKTYSVHYTDPAEIAEVAPAMMASTNELTIKQIDRKLVVNGTAEQHEFIRLMLRDLDTPPKNIRIDVDFGSSGSSRNSEFGVRPGGPIVIRDGEVHGSLEGSFGSRSTTTTENTTQMLVAMDGHSASIRVGERVPYISWLTEYGSRHGYVRDIEIEWKDVGSFLAAEPTIVGPGLIRIRLIPELSGRLKDGKRKKIQFTDLATEVVVADGQTISIGGFSKDEEFSSKFLVGSAPGSRSVNTTITLTPHILP
jgi:type II secretory pathway component GspD/PulD (secretin)